MPIGDCRRIGIADVALERELFAEHLLTELGGAALLAAEIVADRSFGGAGVEQAGHEREEPCRRPRLEDHGVAPGLERARLLALERLVRGGLGEVHRIDQRGVLDAGDARPAGAAAVLRARRQDEARLRILVVGEQSLRVRGAGRLIDLRDVAGAEHALLGADVEALPHRPRPLRRPVVHAARERRVHRFVLLRPDQHRRLGVVARLAGPLQRIGHAVLQGGVVEITHRRGPRLVAEMNGDGDTAVELHHVGGDVGVREAGRRTLAAVELDLDRIGFGHVDHLAGDRLHFIAGVHTWGSRVQGSRFRGSASPVSVSRAARAVRAAGAAAALSRGGRRRAAGGRPHHSRARQPFDQVLALARRTRRRAPGVHVGLELPVTVTALIFEDRHSKY